MHIISELFFPPKCVGCGELLDWETHEKGAFCSKCEAIWNSEKKETCGICAKAVSKCLCATEAMEKAGCKTFCKAVYYLHGKSAPPQNRVIFYIKRNRTERVFRFLAKELSGGVSDALRDLSVAPCDAILTYVPRRPLARLEYGVDQAKLLAEALSRELSVPIQSLLKRSNSGRRAQKWLDRKERFREVKKAYALRKEADVSGKLVILVDDTVTTGATMAACIRLLKRAGAKTVMCVSATVNDQNRERVEKNKRETRA